MALEIIDLNQWHVCKIQFWDNWHFVFLKIYPIKTTVSCQTVEWLSDLLISRYFSVLMNHNSQLFGACVMRKMQSKPIKGQCLKRSKGLVSSNLVIDYVTPFNSRPPWLIIQSIPEQMWLPEWVVSWSWGKCTNYLRQGGYVFTPVCLSVCLFVCLFVCEQTISRSYGWIFMKFCTQVAYGHRKKWLIFGGDPSMKFDLEWLWKVK